MCKLYQADFSEDRQQVRELFTDYLQWVNDKITQS
jgi:lysine/ornithine N-monooxygenase